MKYGYGSKMKSIEYESQSEFQESHVKTNKINRNKLKMIESKSKNQNEVKGKI